MDANLKNAADSLVAAVRNAGKQDQPTKTYIAMEHIDGDRGYDIGEEIELTDADAKQALKLGSVVAKGDKLAAKPAEAAKEREEQEAKDLRAKLEARARGEAPNNLGRIVVGSHGETMPMPLEPGYKVVDSSTGKPVVPEGKTLKASGKGAGVKLEGPVPVQPQVIRSGRGTARGGSKVSYGKPGSTAGKAPVGGKGRGK